MAEKTASSMLELWEKYYNSKKGYKSDWYRLAKKPEINYDKAKMYAKWRYIVAALLFWRFIINNKPETFAQLRKFLDVIIADTKKYNSYIRAVAMIEYLPKTVWRKLLWRQNIDFMGFETFLRRVSQEQLVGISKAYLEFKDGKRPNVFTWYDRNVKWVSFKSLAKEELDYNGRYATKAAMSYNLFNLDFGFNAYPKGIYDDTKVVEISPMRFLSKKQHADDFSVNKEDGMYWWLYRRARANYVINPKREVVLHKAICPGLWFTLLVHLLFWVISPVATLVMTAVWSDSVVPESILGWFAYVPLGLVGLLTPVWILLATLKLVFSSILKLIELLPVKIWKTIYSILMSITVPFGLAFITPKIFYVFERASGGNPFRELLLAIMTLFFIRNLFELKWGTGESRLFPIKFKIIRMRFWRSFPSTSKTFFKITLCLLLGSFLYEHSAFAWLVVVTIGEFIASIAVAVASGIWSFILTMGESFVVFFKEWGLNVLYMLSVGALPIIALVLIDKYSDERKYPKISQHISLIAKVMMFVTVFLGGFIVYASYVSLSHRIDAGVIIAPLIGYILFVLAAVFFAVRRETKYDKRIAENARVFIHYNKNRAIQLTYIALKNKFFLSLSIDERITFVSAIRDLSEFYGEKFNVITHVFGRVYGREDCENLFLSEVKSWETVRKLEEYINSPWVFRDNRGFEKLYLFLGLITKMPVLDAISKIDNEIDRIFKKRIQRRNKRSDFFLWLFSPITNTWEYITDWKRFRDYLHEHCPYVAESKDLLKKQ